jgi:hypothetical protein
VNKLNSILPVNEIPTDEQNEFDKLIKNYREKHIRTSQEIVDLVLLDNKNYVSQIKSKKVSKCISELREIVWKEYLVDEVNFNALLMKDLHKALRITK